MNKLLLLLCLQLCTLSATAQSGPGVITIETEELDVNDFAF